MGRRPTRNYDNRTFVEIWYSLPEAGKKMLGDALKAKKLAKAIPDWKIGCAPVPRTRTRVSTIINQTFGILTRPQFLFPADRDTRHAIANKCREIYELKKWDGAVKWPTLEHPNRRPEDDEIEES